MSPGDELIEDGAGGGPDGDRDSLAGEYALGLLGGEDLLTARGLIARDAGFAQTVADWEARLAPLLDGIAPVAPNARVWVAIAAAMHARDDERSGGGQVAQLRRQVRIWRIGTGIAAALAGVLAIVGLQPGKPPAPLPVPAVVAPPPPLAAALAPKGGGSISVVYHPRDGRLMALAGDLAPRAGRDFELWVLPPGGAPLPLGVVKPGESRQLKLSAETSTKLVPGSTIAVSLEPVGGSPTGLPTGPVLAVAKISAA